MKKIVFFAAVAALAAVSCVKDGYTSDVQTTVVKATVSETKTALVNNTKTYWTKGDQISVFNAGKGNCQFTTAIEEASAHAEFTYTGDWAAPEVYHAFYPYSASIATEDFTTFTGLEIPAIQTAVAGGFDPEAVLLYGEGASADLSFNNLTALIKFTVASDEVYNVKVWATGANIAGQCSFDGEKLTGASSMWVQLKGVMRKGKTFYMAVAYAHILTMVRINTIAVCHFQIVKNTNTINQDISATNHMYCPEGAVRKRHSCNGKMRNIL